MRCCLLEGKDGLTHNMLELLHRHWKRRRVCRIKCYGVPTVDMDNLCRVIEVCTLVSTKYPSYFVYHKRTRQYCLNSLNSCFIFFTWVISLLEDNCHVQICAVCFFIVLMDQWMPLFDVSIFMKQEKSGGKIIRRSQGMLYVFRGRNYNWNTRPQIPIMLWKPPAPIYPSVVQSVPEGLSEKEADNLRALGRRIHCLCRLGKNTEAPQGLPIVKLNLFLA